MTHFSRLPTASIVSNAFRRKNQVLTDPIRSDQGNCCLGFSINEKLPEARSRLSRRRILRSTLTGKRLTRSIRLTLFCISPDSEWQLCVSVHQTFSIVKRLFVSVRYFILFRNIHIERSQGSSMFDASFNCAESAAGRPFEREQTP